MEEILFKGKKLGTLTTDRLIQHECLIWYRLIRLEFITFLERTANALD